MLEFRHASRASKGARSYQEDFSAVWPGRGALSAQQAEAPAASADLVAVLADGMGGHAAGDVASHTICAAFLEYFASSTKVVTDRLGSALAVANDALRLKVEAAPSLAGMGATLVGISVAQSGAHWISVGDSPLFLFRRDELVRLNEDHSLAPLLDQMVAAGKMRPEAALVDPRRHYLRSAVTGEELDLIDASRNPLTLEPGDVLVVASDGILTLDEDRIRRVVAAYRADGVDKIADALIRAVDSAGDPHQDNTTVVIIAAAEAG